MIVSCVMPCCHSAWLEVLHVLVAKPNTSASSSAYFGSVSRRSSNHRAATEAAAIAEAQIFSRTLATTISRASGQSRIPGTNRSGK
jgi:hypothetical protein